MGHREWGRKAVPYSLIFEVEDTGLALHLELRQLFKAFVQTETGRRSQEEQAWDYRLITIWPTHG